MGDTYVQTICPDYNEWQKLHPGVPYPGREFLKSIGGYEDMSVVKYNPSNKTYSADGGETWVSPYAVPDEDQIVAVEAEVDVIAEDAPKQPWELDPDGWEFHDDPFGGYWQEKGTIKVSSDMKTLVDNLRYAVDKLAAAILPGD